MIFTPTTLPGSYALELEKLEDERGFFARAFCKEQFSRHGLETDFVQASTSLSRMRGTLRGLHYQVAPSAEVKLVRCIAGAVHDVIIDLRPKSPAFGRHFAIELSASNRTTLYVPRGFAHGFITLADDAEVFYLVSAFYSKDHERGIRYDDPFFAIPWPMAPVAISSKDSAYPDYDQASPPGM